MNLSVLQTLPDDQYASGMGEVIKTALIRDRELFQLLSGEDGPRIQGMETLRSAVEKCCEIKAAVVEEDPFDRGIRAILNFGHTIGHAVEKEKQFMLLHGHCVALGILAAGRLSVNRRLLMESEFQSIRDCLLKYGLPVKTCGIDPEAVADACLSDKKRERGKLRFVLLQGIGNTCIEPALTRDELLSGIREILD